MQKITLYKIKIIENTIEGNNSNNEKKAEFTQRRSTTALINTDLQDTVIIVFSVSKVASVTPKILPSSPSQPPAPKISPSILNLLSYKVLNFNSIDCMFLSVWIYGWVFIHKLSGCGFESSCSHSNSIISINK